MATVAFHAGPAAAQDTRLLGVTNAPAIVCASASGSLYVNNSSESCILEPGVQFATGFASGNATFSESGNSTTFSGGSVTFNTVNTAFGGGSATFNNTVFFTGPAVTFSTPTTFQNPATFNGTTTFTGGMTTVNITNSGTINTANMNVTGSLTAAPGTTINFGGVNQVEGVAAGDINATSLDAINGSQINAILVAQDTRDDGQDAAIAAISAAIAENAYIAINSTGPAASAAGVDAIAIGENAVASGDASTAVGTEAVASGLSSSAYGHQAVASATAATALGHNSDATALAATAVGVSAQATANFATAIGRIANASGIGATAVGNNAAASGAGAVAVGQNSVANGTNGVAIGNGASNATFANSVALGAGSTNTAANQVHVGGRTIAGVTAGALSATSTEAVNGSQLFAANQNIAALQATDTAFGGRISTLELLAVEFDEDLDRIDERAAAGTATAIAMSGGAFLPGKAFNLTGNVGAYRGAVAGALQIGALVSENAAFNAGVAHGFNKGGKTGVRAGFTFGW